MKRDLLALIGMVICLVFILLAFFTPWYNSVIEGDYDLIGEVKTDSSLYLTKIVTKYRGMGESGTDSHDYTDDVPYKYIFDITLILMIGVFIIFIIALICIILLNFSTQNIEIKIRKFAVIFCIISFILAILAPIFFMVALPNEMEKSGFESASFWYDKKDENSTKTMGPGFAWYFIIITAIILLISSIFLSKKNMFKKVAPT